MRAASAFPFVWWLCNILLVAAMIATICAGVWEFTTREYLKGFSDAIVSESAAPTQKAQAILDWMKNGPPRLETQEPSALSPRDPQDTLNYRQLLAVCGSATNAFLNLSRSAGLTTRRLLLFSPQRTVVHVVAELQLDGRWVVVDPAFRSFLKDAHGNLLTRKDLRNPELLREATSGFPGYSPEYTYERFAHVRLGALPFRGGQVRMVLERISPTWDEYIDWSLFWNDGHFLYRFSFS